MRRSRRDIPSFHLSTPSLPPGPWLNGTAVKTVLWLSGAALKRPRSRFNARFAEIEGDIAFFCDLFSRLAKVANVQTRIFAKSKRRSFVRDLTTIHSSKKCYRRMKISKNVASASCELSHRLLSGPRLTTISPHLSIQNFRLSNFQKRERNFY